MRTRKVTRRVARVMMPELRQVAAPELNLIAWTIRGTMTGSEQRVAFTILRRERARRRRIIVAALFRFADSLPGDI